MLNQCHGTAEAEFKVT